MPQPNDLSRSLAALDENSTLIAVIEMSQTSWLVAGIVPRVERHPLKKLAPVVEALLRLLERWRDEAATAGRTITRIAVAYEAGRDGFWLARWLRAHGIEADVIHPNSIAVSREHCRTKTDRLDTALLQRAFSASCVANASMATIPSLEEEDAKRPGRERENLVGERTRIGNRIKSTLARLGSAASSRPCGKRRRGSSDCARRRENRCRPTPWPSCGARWHACAGSPNRSGRSRPRACSGWNGNQIMEPIQ